MLSECAPVWRDPLLFGTVVVEEIYIYIVIHIIFSYIVKYCIFFVVALLLLLVCWRPHSKVVMVRCTLMHRVVFPVFVLLAFMTEIGE